MSSDTEFPWPSREALREELQDFVFTVHGAAVTWRVLYKVREHLAELADAWERGAIVEHDGQGGLRSNRNRELLAEIDEVLGDG